MKQVVDDIDVGNTNPKQGLASSISDGEQEIREMDIPDNYKPKTREQQLDEDFPIR